MTQSSTDDFFIRVYRRDPTKGEVREIHLKASAIVGMSRRQGRGTTIVLLGRHKVSFIEEEPETIFQLIHEGRIGA